MPSLKEKSIPSMTSTQKKYKPHSMTPYCQLDPSKSQIRICHVLPQFKHGRLACELKEASLDDLPRYRCLSYVWGKHKDRAEVILNGKLVEVTSNLYIVLQQLQVSGHGEAI